MYCEKCDTHIDTDFDCEHFDSEVDGCETEYQEEIASNEAKI